MRPIPSVDSPSPILKPERRLALVAEVLARGVRRHLAIAAQAPLSFVRIRLASTVREATTDWGVTGDPGKCNAA
jgi:hypothetical protein